MRRSISVLFALFLLPFTAQADTPNVVLIFCDDLGYADVACYGGKIPTPNLDRLAQEGLRFTDFYVAQAVCSASRAALLTGCYSNRVGILGALPPNAKTGINPDEITMAEMFKSRGYPTAIYGKWHLGDAPQFLPTRHGFDEYFGIPYSNDMWHRHPTIKGWPQLPLMENEKVVQLDPDQRNLTKWYTERAIDFINRNREHPFFLYVPHSMPHVPLHASDKFAGKSGHGLYGDVIQEIDWSVGQIVEAIDRHKLGEKTIVIFTSDNGPWLYFGDHGGSAGNLREGKTTVFEGGVRVPCIARWPGRIPAGTTCTQMAATIDLMPTLAKLIGAEMPTDRIIDGKDIGALLHDASAKSPRDTMYFYWGKDLHAVRSENWKLHLPHPYQKPDPPGSGGEPGKNTKLQIGLSLFDLANDPAETTDLSEKHPDVVERLMALAEHAREDLGDGASERAGKNVRPPGQRQE